LNFIIVYLNLNTEIGGTYTLFECIYFNFKHPISNQSNISNLTKIPCNQNKFFSKEYRNILEFSRDFDFGVHHFFSKLSKFLGNHTIGVKVLVILNFTKPFSSSKKE